MVRVKRNINTIIIVGVVSLLGIVNFFILHQNSLRSPGEIISFFSGEVMVVSLMILMLQFRSNHLWRKREKAMEASLRIKEHLYQHALVLDKHFDYINLGAYGEAISVVEIHQKICKKDGAGNLVVHHHLKTKKSQYVLDRQEGKLIRTAIVQHLNEFEYLACGVHQGVFDEGVVLDLLKDSLIKAYHIFYYYIEHMNVDHAQIQNKEDWSIWNNLVILAEKHSYKRVRKKERWYP